MSQKLGKPKRISGPGINWRRLSLWGGFVIVCAAFTVATILYVKKSRQANAEKQSDLVLESSGLPTDFFPSAQALRGILPAPAAPASTPPPAPPAPPAKPPAPPVPPPPLPASIKAADIFPALVQESAEESPRKGINAQRRGKVAVRVSAEFAGLSAGPAGVTSWRNSQEVWNEEREQASFPVDLSRILPIDRIFSAILQNEINSELGGKVVAQIESDVYGAHGRNVLIPAGSHAVGRYKPLEKVGSERLEIHWVRIITPDGINIHTANAEMTDSMGRSGITGELDRRYMEKFGTSFLVSTVQVLAAYTVKANSKAEETAMEQFGNNVGNLARAILQENLDIKPRLTIPSGARILITPSKDIIFPKPVRNTVEVVDASRSAK